MDLHLEGRTAVVTGAGKGIGLAVAAGLVAEGATVIAGSRSPTAGLLELAASGRLEFVQVDLATPGGPAELIDHAARAGGLDILVNNVGAVTPRQDGFLAVTDEQWAATFELSFYAALRATRAAVPLLLERGRGTVVTVGSVNAFLPDPGVVDYSAAKAAIWNLSKSLSKEYGPRGLRFNTVSPGPVSTDLWLGADGVAATAAARLGVDLETAKARVIESQGGFSTGRFTTAEEVADLVLLLASDRAGNVTGADFLIDGGLVKTL